MARPVWTGSVSFGLVTIPVKLFTATEDHDIHFHNLERDTGERIRHRRVAESSGHEVASENIVKGYEVRPGEHVIVEQDELEAVEPGRSRAIEIEDFVDLDGVDPIYFDRTYFVTPDDSSARPYELLRRVLDEMDMAGIARFAMRGKQHLCAIRPYDGSLALETMYFADEVREPERLDGVARDVDVDERELSAARQLVESLRSEWEPERYEDTYRDRVMELIERKAEGESVVTEEPEEEGGEVVDLMAALEASVNDARSRRSSSAGRGARGRKAGDLSSLTREELYERAQDSDIEGRSKMSKEELVDALREAS